MPKFSLRTILGLVALVALVTVFGVEWMRSSPPAWENYSSDKLKDALANKRLVLIMFSANWDQNGFMVERQAINSRISCRTIRSNGIVTLRADYTNQAPNVVELMNKIGINTVPAIALYSPMTPEDPLILRDLVTEADLMEAIAFTKHKRQND